MKPFIIIILAGLALLLGCSEDSDTSSPTQPLNHAPIIHSVSASPNELPHYGSTTLTCIATDEDRDSLTYIWGAREGSLSGSGAEVEWHAPEDQGSYWIRVTVSDRAAIASDSVRVSVMPNRPPVIQSLTANPTEVVHGGSSTLTCTASDEDGDNLAYTWTPSSGSIPGSGSSVQWLAPQVTGSFGVAVTVSDGREVDVDSLKFIVSAPNEPPVDPWDPSPRDCESNVVRPVTLTWKCSDVDGDSIFYDLYFGRGTPSLIQRDLDTAFASAPELQSNMSYAWRVVARDSKGHTNSGPTWLFQTQ